MKPAFGGEKKTQKKKRKKKVQIETYRVLVNLSLWSLWASCKWAMFTVNVSAKHYF